MEVKMEEDLLKKILIWIVVILISAHFIIEYEIYRPTKPAEEML